MEGIYETNSDFDFSKLTLTTPTVMSGGNYFIKYLINGSPLYIQPPKCKTKGGIAKGGKRTYCDLLFTNENENFIRWMEDLENYTCKYIFNNREKWFETDMELHDIENYFTSPLKIYKSGKFYLARTNITTRLGKISLKIYDESEEPVDTESIGENTNVVTIIEVQGIKCSARSFQIELEVKQMMVVKSNDELFEKCLLKINDKPIQKITPPMDLEENDPPTPVDLETTEPVVSESPIQEAPASLEETAKKMTSDEISEYEIDLDNVEELEEVGTEPSLT
jgi:hypothetical protein